MNPSVSRQEVPQGGTSQHVVPDKVNTDLFETEAAGSLSSTSMS